ncbi:hypothetical protein GILI108418_04610 [Gillisia limnaea]
MRDAILVINLREQVNFENHQVKNSLTVSV